VKATADADSNYITEYSHDDKPTIVKFDFPDFAKCEVFLTGIK